MRDLRSLIGSPGAGAAVQPQLSFFRQLRRFSMRRRCLALIEPIEGGLSVSGQGIEITAR